MMIPIFFFFFLSFVHGLADHPSMDSGGKHVPGCKCGRHWAVNPRCDCGQRGPDNIPGDLTRCSDARGPVRRLKIPPCARKRRAQERALDVVHITVDGRGRAPLFADSEPIVWSITNRK